MFTVIFQHQYLLESVLDQLYDELFPPRNTMQMGEIKKIMFSLQCKILSCLISTLIFSLQLSVKLTERKVATNHGIFNQHSPERHCCNDYSNESATAWTDLLSNGSLNHGD